MTKKRKFIKHLPLVLASLALGLGVFVNVNKVAVESSAIGNYSTNASTYYNDVTATSGKQLAAQLHDLITSTHRYYTSYADNGGNLYQQHTDQYYENGSAVNGYIYEFYSGVKWPNAWDANAGSTTGGYNREHCWCQSNSVPSGSSSQLWGESGGGSDMHHIRPTENRLNSTRGNDKYGTVSNRDSNKAYAKYGSSTTYHGGYSANSTFEPLDSKKGDVARIILYVYLHYNSYTVSDLFGSYGTTNGSGSASYFATSLLPLTNTVKANSESAALTLLLNWNSSDPVDEIEQRRNEQVAIYQGNRNPFIDNSNYANLIWGSGSSSDPSATISPSSPSVAVANTINLTATLSNVSNANLITWDSSNDAKATVEKGTTSTTSSVATVTGVAEGSVTIYCKYNGTTIGSVTVTVTSSGGQGGDSNEYSLYSGSISEGDYLIVYNNKAMNTTVTSNRLMYTTVSSSNNKITTSDSSIIWHIAADGNYWTIYNSGEDKYAAATSSNNQATLISSITDYARWTVSGSSTYEFVNKSNSRYLRENTTYGYGCYATTTGGALSLYKKSQSSSKTLTSITISGYTTTFVEGGTFSFGGTVTAHYSDNSTENVTSQATFSGYDLTITGSQTVTVTYSGQTKTYSITVNKGTLSSIAVSGYTSTYSKGSAFTFDGVCTATFANGYQKEVAPTSVSSPDMSTAGTKTVTVSYTYNGSTKSTAYTITVTSGRTVIETITSTKSSTITWPTSSTPSISGNIAGLSAVLSGKTVYESNSIRLGTGNGGGTISISSTDSISNLEVSAKYYSSSYSSAVLKVDGHSISTLTANYESYPVALASPKTSFTILTENSYSRVNIESITLYSVVSTSTNISSTDDCIGLESFIETYMHMDYTQNLGYCKDNTHHYYSTAKAAFNALNTHQRSLFVNNSAYATEWARLAAWASANGESINSNNQLTQRTSLAAIQEIATNSNIIVLMAVILVVGISAIGMYVYINKKRIKE